MTGAQFRRRLIETGITAIAPLYAPETISGWGATLDHAFEKLRSEDRSYLAADEVLDLGLFDEVFTATLRRLIWELMADAVIYQCHIYEIAANQDRPHIEAHRLDGWHRDAETVTDHDPRDLRFVSLFVYLTDVGDEGGAFDFLAQPMRWPLIDSKPAVHVTGPAGTSFLWNRSFFHRASPNRSDVRRRVLKISVQPRTRPNCRLGLPQFQAVRDVLRGKDPFLESLFGRIAEAMLPQPEGELPEIFDLPPGRMIHVRPIDEAALALRQVRLHIRR